MKILVIWRLLTVGGVNAGWRNRAIYFKKYGIQTEFLYTKRSWWPPYYGGRCTLFT